MKYVLLETFRSRTSCLVSSFMLNEVHHKHKTWVLQIWCERLICTLAWQFGLGEWFANFSLSPLRHASRTYCKSNQTTMSQKFHCAHQNFSFSELDFHEHDTYPTFRPEIHAILKELSCHNLIRKVFCIFYCSWKCEAKYQIEIELAWSFKLKRKDEFSRS